MNVIIDTRISKYLGKIGKIDPGGRNESLYDIGILLRTRFGSYGDALLSALLEVNHTKCTEPLPDDEVARIAKSVDKSNARLGESRWGAGASRVTVRHRPRTTEYNIVLGDTIPTAPILENQISVYSKCWINTPSGETTIGAAFEEFKTGTKYRGLVEAVRAISDKEKRKKLKQATLPGVVFASEPQSIRNVAACIPNGVIGVDCDGIPKDKLEELKKTIAALPYVVAVFISASGNGLFVLIAYKGTPDLKELLATLQKDFPCKIDSSCSDISRLRFFTFDENPIIKDVVRPAILVECQESADDIDDIEPLRHDLFPVDRLPHTLANMAKDTQRCINLKDPAMPAVSVLAVISSVVGSSCRIEIMPGYTEPPALFVAIVGDSGAAKSGSARVATRHLKALQAEQIKQWRRSDHDWKQEHNTWKNTPKKERGDEPMPPLSAKRFIISDATIEAVAVILENNPLGVLLDRDELKGLLGGLDAFKNASTDLQSWIEIFEGEGLTVDRKTSGMIHVDKPSVSILGGIQTVILKQMMQKRDDFIYSGFSSRFLYVMPEKVPVMWQYNSPNTKAVADYENLIDHILADRESVLEKDDTDINAFATVNPIVFTLSEGARHVLYAFQKRHAMQAIYENAANAAAMNKAGRIAARICLTLHAVRSIEETGRLGGRPVVATETAEDAVAIAGWFLYESERVYAMLAGERVGGELTDDQREVMRVLHRIDEPKTVRDMKRRSRPLQKMDSLDEGRVEKVLEELVKLGKVERHIDMGVGNHGTVRYCIKRQPLTADVDVRNSPQIKLSNCSFTTTVRLLFFTFPLPVLEQIYAS